MTDKEKIEIDGVDVGGCSVYKNGLCLVTKNKCNARCDYAAYYLYEQLARKTQECEELKKTVLTKCPNCNSEYLTPKGIELYEENKKLKKESEELKKENSKLTFLFEESRKMKLKAEKQVYELVNENNKLKNLLKRTTCQAECYKHKEAERYEQALDDILEFIDREDWSILEHVDKGIKDIIDKAKGEGNEI